MAKSKISPAFKARLSEKLMDLGNLTVAALVLGQFVSKETFSTERFIGGITAAVVCYVMSYIISN